MDFTELNWISIFKPYKGFPLHRWLCVYFATFPLLSGCEPLNNIPCTITHYETQVMMLKCLLPPVSTPTTSLSQNETASTPPPPSSAPTTPPSKAVGRLPALG